jgi:hypothetical protein
LLLPAGPGADEKSAAGHVCAAGSEKIFSFLLPSPDWPRINKCQADET